MPSIYVRLNVSPQECLTFYQNPAPNVHTRSIDGRSVIFPRRLLYGMVGHDGICGLFRITYSEDGKFQSLERVSS